MFREGAPCAPFKVPQMSHRSVLTHAERIWTSVSWPWSVPLSTCVLDHSVSTSPCVLTVFVVIFCAQPYAPGILHPLPHLIFYTALQEKSHLYSHFYKRGITAEMAGPTPKPSLSPEHITVPCDTPQSLHRWLYRKVGREKPFFLLQL